MKFNENSGYILFLNLILITLFALFIPVLIQQHKINYRILNNRIIAAQKKEAVEAGLEYQLYHLKKNNMLLEEIINLNEEIEISIRGEEDDSYFYLRAEVAAEPDYISELKIKKNNLEVVSKKIFRSE